MLAHAHAGRVLSLVNIEENVAPEDCFLSRQIVDLPSDSAERLFDHFIERTRHAPALTSALYAPGVGHKVKAGAVAGILRSKVNLSDHGALMDKFLALPTPRMFMFGQQNASLSYLPVPRSHGVCFAAIPDCGHFPMYSNPVLMWRATQEVVSSPWP